VSAQFLQIASQAQAIGAAKRSLLVHFVFHCQLADAQTAVHAAGCNEFFFHLTTPTHISPSVQKTTSIIDAQLLDFQVIDRVLPALRNLEDTLDKCMNHNICQAFSNQNLTFV